MDKIIEKKFEDIDQKKYLDLNNLNIDEFIISHDNEKYCIIKIGDENISIKLRENFYILNYLFIGDNKLKCINLNFDMFANLKVVDISDNPNLEELTFLPRNLEELVCNNCQLTKICSHDVIKKIHCMDNKIASLENFPSLEDLKCDNNKIQFINSMLRLKKLSCTNNPLIKIDYLPNLLVLDCSLTLLAGKISFAPIITHLICHNTNITDISELNEIYEIEFNDSQIQYLPYLPKLKSIIFNNKDLKLSPNYKIKNFLEYGGNIDIVFE